MRVPSGSTDRSIYFYAVDETDKSTPETGLSSFTVYRSRDGGTMTQWTTPTITEFSSSPQVTPGVYCLLVDEDTTIDASHDTEEMVIHISHAGMQTVVRTIELYRPETTEGETIGVSSGAVSNVTLVATTTTNTDMRGTDSAFLAANAPTNFSDLAITVTTGQVTVGTNNDKTGYSISGTKTTLDSLNDVSTAQVNAEVDTALADYDSPTKAELDAGLAALNDPTAAAIADAVWDEDLSVGHSVVGSAAVYLKNTHSHAETVETQIGTAGAGLTDLGGMSTGMKAEVNAEVDTALADYDPPTKAELDSGLAALNDPSAATIADAVLDEALSGHTTAGTLGKAVADIETDAAAILVDTGTTIPAQITGLNDLSAAQVNAEVDTALSDYDGPTKAEMDTAFAAVPTATENADALLNRDMSAVSDTNSRSPLNALRFLRNLWAISGTTLTVKKEDDSTTAWTATVSTDASADPVTGSDPA